MQYGLWLYLNESKKNKYNQILYKCRCKCGLEKYVLKYNLEHGYSKGCISCVHREDKLLNKKFGNLLVIESLKNKKSLCLCNCGNKKTFLNGNLISGNAKSCGCLQSINRGNYDEEAKLRFMENIKISLSGCWEWTKSKHRQGYGNFMYKMKHCLAHRVAWLLFKGVLKEKDVICHKCDNTSCVNPDHLFLGTQKDNMKDMFLKHRKDHKGIKHPKHRLTEQEFLEIRKLINEGLTQEVIAQKFKITNSQVGSIKHRRTWKHI
jgi:hypothetical protein